MATQNTRKFAVITGASSGIGEALARHYASQDSVLGLISRRQARPGLPGTVVPYAVDVTDVPALERAAADWSPAASSAQISTSNPCSMHSRASS